MTEMSQRKENSMQHHLHYHTWNYWIQVKNITIGVLVNLFTRN